MAYHHSQQLHKRQRRSKRILRFSFFVVLVVGVAAIAITIDNFINKSQSIEIASTGTQARVQAASINIFRTPYFQFQADKSWREVTDQGDPKRFVYRSYSQQLVQHELVVEVDDIKSVVLANENTTRVFPVIIENSRLVPDGNVSEHCNTMVEEDSKEQVRLSYKEAEFPCNPDGSSFVSAVSVISDDEIIEHTNDDGVSRQFKLTYQDSTFSPNGRPLFGILNSFQLF